MNDMSIKAIYNNILFHGGIPATSDWQKRNWRKASVETLFSELDRLGVDLDKPRFLSWAKESESPEDLLLLLAPEEERSDEVDHLYLILFELWRRFVPERRSLSIIADDIDHAIVEYHTIEDEERREELSQRLVILFLEYIRILQVTLDDVHEDEELQAHAIFSMSQSFFVHDIARFLFDFVIEEVDQDSCRDLSAVVHGIYPFIVPSSWAGCMSAHILWYEDEERAIQLGKQVSKEIFSTLRRQDQHQDQKDGESEKEVLGALGLLWLSAKAGNKELFHLVMKSLLDLEILLSPSDLFDLLAVSALFAETTHHPMLSQVIAVLEEMELSYEEEAPGEHVSMNTSSRTLLRRLIEG